MKKYILLFLVTSILTIYSGKLHANTVLFEHSGSNNPTTEGWTHNVGAGGGTSSGAAGNAWYVEDASVAGGSWESYSQTANSTQVADASVNGWTLSTTLLMANGSTGVFNSIFAQYVDGTNAWTMWFDIASDGDPIISIGHADPEQAFGSYTVEGGAGSYHTYSLLYDPVLSSTDVYVDGIEQISDFTGRSQTDTYVAWGAGASNGTGRADFSSVQFSVVPEPISTTLFIVGGATLGFRRFRKKFKK